ncbi:hypothetical protein BDZ88DRAFT_418216 [Geranomyces variabilis]|nr:hypothetical protein BDZ88DRAFT_418216 [Geranomyces variabilis]KAJ3140596.1 hypothetical protein HDU90_007897 [Geranomyces variabilis]
MPPAVLLIQQTATAGSLYLASSDHSFTSIGTTLSAVGPALDISCAILAALIILIYHLYLVHAIRRGTRKTVFAATREVRRRWLTSILESRQDILVTQGMRNQIMASTFLASTAVAISFGILAFINSFLQNDSRQLSGLFIIRVSMLFVVYACSFFAFTQSIRYFNHVVFCTNTAALGDLGEEFALGLLDRGGLFSQADFGHSTCHSF